VGHRCADLQCGRIQQVTFPIPADPSQQALLDAVWEEFTLRGQWPSFGQVDRRVDRYRGLAGDELIRSSSNELVQSGGHQQYPQDDQQLRLTIAGVAACTTGEAALYVRLFLDVIRLATEAEAGAPLDVTEPAALGSEEVRTRLTLPAAGREEVLWRLSRVLLVEQWGYTHSSANPQTRTWSFTLNRQVRRFRDVQDLGDYWRRAHPQADPPAPPASALELPVTNSDPTVFLVHGHDQTKHQVARVIDQLTGREPVILDEQTSRGRTLLEKFEDHAATAALAVVLLTPDDFGGVAGAPQQPRARQNVVFELGYFCGRLGRRNVIVLNAGVEQPSDITGLVYIPMNDGSWKLKLGRELSEAQVPVDFNGLR